MGAVQAPALAAAAAPELPTEKSEPLAQSAPVLQQLPAANGKPAARVAVTPVPAAPAPADAPSDNLSSQVSAIREARAAMRRGEPQAAIAAIDRQFPEGQASTMEPEATLARVAALCRLGDVVTARRVADRFLARFPESPLGARLRGSCAFDPVTQP